ncbi:streptophobe family protein [Kitasatospora sp. NPDC096147]|uniref:streptophobe family protein n=1 Tax=Kitasatospora sp. NPDC096147 TaxID=3364093 RepID=UPI0037FD12EF
MSAVSAQAGPPRGAVPLLRPWGEALLTALVPLLLMAALAALGLRLAGADALPSGAFPAVVAATVLMALGVPVELNGTAAFVAEAQGGLEAMPLSVTLLGALTAGYLFLRPLRLRAVTTPAELAARAGRTALFWLVLIALLRLPAEHSFAVPTGDPLLDDLGAAFGAGPVVGFRLGLLPTLGIGLLWLAGVLLLTLLASRRAPLPPALLRHRAAVQPAAHAVLMLLLLYVVIALVAGLVTAAVSGRPATTFAVIALALPNLAWLALGIGLGGSWHGSAPTDIGLPMPPALAEVLRVPADRQATLDLSTLAAQDGRAWLLAAVTILLAGYGAARHTTPAARPWQYAAHLAAALAVAVLLLGLVTRISAALGLSLLGFDAAGGGVSLIPDLLRTVGLAALWGALAGLLGGLAAHRAP